MKIEKRIIWMYMISAVVVLAAGSVFAWMIRSQLLDPKNELIGKQTYNQAFTFHGVIMIFLFIIPAIPSQLGALFKKKDKGE